jgi:predicted 2-oxoglutarate/Fe(II)-dependent dioxygenase YbiX
MAQARFFAHLGLFVIERFFQPELCAQLRTELRTSAGSPGTVAQHGRSYVDETVRKATGRLASTPTTAAVGPSIAAIRADLERHFGLQLADNEPPYFASYRTGDYFRPHADTGTTADGPEQIRARKVTVVVFLNEESELPGPDSYGGGALTFYGLFDDPAWKPMGLPLKGETGLLVGFRADLIHEVAPVTHGERWTVVSRFW